MDLDPVDDETPVTIDAAILSAVSGRIREKMEPWVPYVNTAAHQFAIHTRARMAAWLAQCSHESAGFNRLEENLNYSAEGLLATFHKYFTPAQAKEYARQPERIANRVYANRMGNGDEASGDGWRYRGMGLIMLTGKAMVKRAGDVFGVDLSVEPSLLLGWKYAALSAAWFWDAHGCNDLADKGDFVAITKRINGGVIGLADRTEAWARARQALAGDPGGY